MIASLVATVCAGVFGGADVYVTAVEHPARMSCGPALAVREFGPSYRRGAIMQISMALAGALGGLVGFWMQRDFWLLLASLLLAVLIPFTLIFIMPTTKQLLDPALDGSSDRAAALLARWGRRHAARTGLGLLAFLVILWRVANG
jgi:hypothetical protein